MDATNLAWIFVGIMIGVIISGGNISTPDIDDIQLIDSLENLFNPQTLQCQDGEYKIYASGFIPRGDEWSIDPDGSYVQCEGAVYEYSYPTDFNDSRLNVTYIIYDITPQSDDNGLMYNILYIDNDTIKAIQLPQRIKNHRSRIDEHKINEMVVGNKSTLTLNSIDYSNYPTTSDGFNTYMWDIVVDMTE